MNWFSMLLRLSILTQCWWECYSSCLHIFMTMTNWEQSVTTTLATTKLSLQINGAKEPWGKEIEMLITFSVWSVVLISQILFRGHFGYLQAGLGIYSVVDLLKSQHKWCWHDTVGNTQWSSFDFSFFLCGDLLFLLKWIDDSKNLNMIIYSLS